MGNTGGLCRCLIRGVITEGRIKKPEHPEGYSDGPSDWIRTSGLLNPIQADVPQQRHRGTTEKPRLKSRKALIRLDFYTLIVPHCRQNYNHFLCEAERKSAQIFEICALFVRFCGKARGEIVPSPKCYRFSNCFFFASNSSCVITPLSSFLYHYMLSCICNHHS